MQNKNIVFFINDISPVSGTQRVCAQICSHLCGLGYGISIVSIYQSHKVPFFSINRSVRLYSLFDSNKKGFSSKLLVPLKLRQILKSIRADAVVAVDTYYCPATFLATFLSDVKHIAWEHFNSELYTLFGRRWFGRKIAALHCEKIVVLTEEDATNWKKRIEQKNKITTISNSSPYNVLMEPPIVVDNIVLAAGRFAHQKGFDLLIDAWKQLPSELREKWKLRIVGPPGSAERTIVDLVSKLQLHDSVELVIGFNDMEEEYRRAGLYVLSSRYEGFGLTLIEAMAFGIPVIAFQCPMGPAEILREGAGILVENGNTQQLSGQIQEFMCSRDKRHEYALKSLVRSKEYSIDKVIKKWDDMLMSL